jgi:hypothetical protein
MSHGLSDDLLRELGLITWESITLEDHVYQVAGHLTVDPDRDPVGTCIRKASLKLQQLQPDRDLDDAIAWFEAARVALEDRNALMHGLPKVAFRRTPEGTLYPDGVEAIEDLGRENRIGRVTALEIGALRKISSRLANVNARWQAVTIGVARFRDVPWGPIKLDSGHAPTKQE